MATSDQLRKIVERHWHHHAACSHFSWRLNHEGWYEAAPIFQEIVGGKSDGMKVWSAFFFDIAGFLAEPGVEVEQMVARTYCIECSPTPLLMIRGRFEGQPFGLRLHLEPIPGTEPTEFVDTQKQTTRPIIEEQR